MIVAATGHRPAKLGGYSRAAQDRSYCLARAWIEQHRPAAVISGMAQGWDTAIADAAIDTWTPLICAIPFDGQHRAWPEPAQRRYSEILLQAAEIVVVSPGGYSAAAMQRRNEWMVDRADGMLALWDGSSGGTGNCLRYAWAIGKPVVNLWPYL